VAVYIGSTILDRVLFNYVIKQRDSFVYCSATLRHRVFPARIAVAQLAKKLSFMEPNHPLLCKTAKKKRFSCQNIVLVGYI
jgi:hypothetical protein